MRNLGREQRVTKDALESHASASDYFHIRIACANTVTVALQAWHAFA